MQTVADEQSIGQGVWIEIRSRWPVPPTPTPELSRLGLRLLERSRLLHFDAPVGPLEPGRLTALIDPLSEVASPAGPHDPAGYLCVDVFCRPGVTDTEGEMASLALGYAGLPGLRCHAGLRYRFDGTLPIEARPAVERLVGNPLIHRFIWRNGADRRPYLVIPDASPAQEPSGDSLLSLVEPVSAFDLRLCDDQTLLSISRSRNLGLDLSEMRTVADYFRKLGRPATDVELQSVALTWSEHCCHKTFKATVHFEHDGRREVLRGLLQSCIIAPTAALARPWVRSAFDDNAGVIAFDSRHDLAFKVETHNHPSALEPYGGAHTGVGGVIRDVLAVSAEPIANTDVLCFGPPDLPDAEVPPGVFHPRTTYREVVRGVADYGNNMGIPTVGGAILFHPEYTANPLVYCGTLGLAPRGSHPRAPRPGDAVVLLGGRTGRDGLHGATMSSAGLDRDSVAGSAVQIGAPIAEKTLRDVLPHLRDERLYHAITDCGAGGLCSAVGEMGADLGVEVDLARVPLKYVGLQPWEIWLSEAQERMVLAVDPADLPRVFALCRAYGVEATPLGSFRQDGWLILRYGQQVVARLEMAFLHGGRPHRTLQARWTQPPEIPSPSAPAPPPDQSLLQLLAHPTIASKESVIRRYDHEVQGATVIKPLTGRSGPSDAAVLQPRLGPGWPVRSWRGVVVSHGVNPLYGALDPHAMATLAVDEALRNLAAVGGSIDRAALLDNFCWGDVDDPDELGRLVRAVQGCRDAALAYRVPFVSGKDSLRNVSLDGQGSRSIPGTLLVSAVGVIPDVRRTATMDLKGGGSRLYLLGTTRDELGGSHYLSLRRLPGGRVPRVRPQETRRVMRCLTRAIRKGLVLSCHDLSEGGLGVAAAEMAIAGGLGLEIDLALIGGSSAETSYSSDVLLFSESPGRFLVEIAPGQTEAFELLFARLPCARIGEALPQPTFVIRRESEKLVSLQVDDLETAWRREP